MAYCQYGNGLPTLERVGEIMREKGMMRMSGLTTFTVLKGFFGFFLSGDSKIKPRGKGKVAPVPRSTGAVLVIDDDAEYLEAIRKLLFGTGFDVMTTTSAAKGLEIMRYYQGDLQIMLLDCSMPRLNGAETLEYARRIKPQKSCAGKHHIH